MKELNDENKSKLEEGEILDGPKLSYCSYLSQAVTQEEVRHDDIYTLYMYIQCQSTAAACQCVYSSAPIIATYLQVQMLNIF